MKFSSPHRSLALLLSLALSPLALAAGAEPVPNFETTVFPDAAGRLCDAGAISCELAKKILKKVIDKSKATPPTATEKDVQYAINGEKLACTPTEPCAPQKLSVTLAGGGFSGMGTLLTSAKVHTCPRECPVFGSCHTSCGYGYTGLAGTIRVELTPGTRPSCPDPKQVQATVTLVESKRLLKAPVKLATQNPSKDGKALFCGYEYEKPGYFPFSYRSDSVPSAAPATK